MNRFLLLLATLFSTIVNAAPAAAPRPEFTVRIAADDPRRVYVESRFTMAKPDISLADWGAEQFPEGWGKFVHGLKAFDADGREIVLEGGPQAWKLKAASGSAVRLNYEVRLDHDQHAWPHGLDEAVYVKPDAIFAVGMALFVSPDDTASATVKFELPPGWRASTPWKKIAGDRYEVASGDELLSNALMLGRHQEWTFTQDGMQVTLAAGGRMKNSAAMLQKVMRPAIAAYVRLFGGVPKPAYLVTLHEGLTDGGAFAGSYSMLASEDLSQDNLIDWGHIVAHETFHLWNGTGMKPKGQLDWFKEGFTDYYTILILHRLKLTSDALFTKKLESHVRRTLGDHKLSLAEAGRDKKNNWSWIYGGGAMTALVLDVRIREASGGRRSLDHVMRAMFAEFKSKPYTLADLKRVANSVAGADVSDVFTQHVEGTQPLPLKQAFASLGYALIVNTQGEALLVPVSKPSAAQRAMAAAW